MNRYFLSIKNQFQTQKHGVDYKNWIFSMKMKMKIVTSIGMSRGYYSHFTYLVYLNLKFWEDERLFMVEI